MTCSYKRHEIEYATVRCWMVTVICHYDGYSAGLALLRLAFSLLSSFITVYKKHQT